MSVIKIVGAQIIANTVFANSTVGNTCANSVALYVFNAGTGATTITVATGTSNVVAVGTNVGTITVPVGNYILLGKGRYDQIFAANTSNTMQFTPIAAGPG